MNPTSDLKLWVLGGAVTILVPVVGFFLVREFRRKDEIGEEVKGLACRVTLSVEKLNEAVAALTLAIEEIRVWSHERFITREEYREDMKILREGSVFGRRRFDRCAAPDCPHESARVGGGAE